MYARGVRVQFFGQFNHACKRSEGTVFLDSSIMHARGVRVQFFGQFNHVCKRSEGTVFWTVQSCMQER